MKKISKIFICLVLGLTVADVKDKWPMDHYSMQRLFQTMQQTPEDTKLHLRGWVPDWLHGAFYRNGPAIYEWGDEEYHHMFDPNGIIQRFAVEDGEVTYNSRYIESRNYLMNKEHQKICAPEIGTYGELPWVTEGVEDEGEIKKNRLNFIQNYYPTTNSLVSVMPFHGWLLSMNESPIIHLHDPYTLEVVHEIDIRESPKLPDTFRIATMTAHGMYDLDDGTYWNSGVGLDLSGPFPRVGYYVVKSENAYHGFNRRATPQEILNSLEFSAIAHNKNPLDISIGYYHMFGITDNFIVLPLSSVKMDSKMLFSEMLNAQPLINALVYDPEQNYIYKIFNKKDFRWELVEFESEPGVQTHLINAYESTPGVIKIDTLLAGNGDAMSLMMFEHMNKTGQDLLDVFELMAPIGTTTQYELDMSKLDMDVHQKITIGGRPMFPEDVDKNEAAEWKCFHQGGIEFPILDFKNSMGKDYDHFWVNGFGTAMPDRIYHVKISTRERWVYMEEGYSPSEPGFMKNPTGIEDDDGIVVTVMSPFHDPELRPFIAFLHGKTLEELGRAYLPENIKIPVGFHGLWVPYEN